MVPMTTDIFLIYLVSFIKDVVVEAVADSCIIFDVAVSFVNAMMGTFFDDFGILFFGGFTFLIGCGGRDAEALGGFYPSRLFVAIVIGAATSFLSSCDGSNVASWKATDDLKSSPPSSV